MQHGERQSRPVIRLTEAFGVAETSDTSVGFKRLNAYPSTWFAELTNSNTFPSGKESWKNGSRVKFQFILKISVLKKGAI